MGLYGYRARRTRTDKTILIRLPFGLLLGLPLGWLGACTAVQTSPEPATTAESSVTTASPSVPAGSGPRFEAGVDLPAGLGREIVVNECLVCHELAVLELFKGFYTRDSWRSLVVSMRAHGADVDDAEVEVVSDYLTQHFGVGSP